MSKKYFFFNSELDEKGDNMGRKKNKHKNKQKQSETKPRFPLELDEKEPCGFASAVDRQGHPTSSREETSMRKFDDDEYPYGGYNSSYGSSSSYANNKKQPAQILDNVISTSQGFMEICHSSAWGTVLIPVEDPKALTLSMEEMNTIKLIESFPKIPTKLWSRWIKLCLFKCHGEERVTDTNSDVGVVRRWNSEKREFETVPPKISKIELIRTWNSEKKDFEFFHYVNGVKVVIDEPNVYKSEKYEILNQPYNIYNNSVYRSSTPSFSSEQLEVSALLCRKMDDLSQWMILIPKQQVSHASVSAETAQSIDLETGEAHTTFPPLGWLHAGSTHSHNTMSAFFSSTDDRSELTVPGLHIVVGSIKKDEDSYEAKASVVLRQCRKMVDIKDVVDTEFDETVTFHANVLECISTFSSTTKVEIISKGNPSDKSDKSDNSGSSDDTEVMTYDSEEISPKEDEESWWSFFKKRVLSSYKTKLEAEERGGVSAYPGLADIVGWE